MASEPTWFHLRSTAIGVPADELRDARVVHAVAGADRPRFGVIHRPDAAITATGIGLVIVPPFGAEAIAADRSIVRLADDAARAGVLAIRFDLDGTGNSAGDDLDGARVEAWLASVGDACDLARREGADRIVLVGVRTGVLIATLAAGRRADIAGLIAIAAVPSGRVVVRELREAHLALALPAPPAGVTGDVDLDEIVGFALTAETRVSVAQIDLLRLAQRPAPAALLLDRDDLPGNDAWATRLTELRAEVTHRRVAGYAELARGDIPAELVAAVVAFAATRPPLAATSRPEPRATETTARVELRAGDAVVIEELVELANGARAIAIRNADGTSPRRALVLLDADAARATGPHRMYVGLARELAAASLDLIVLRVALPEPPATAAAAVYRAAIAAAVEWCHHAGARRVTVLGIGDAADHALAACASGPAIERVIAIDPTLATLDRAVETAPHRLFERGTFETVLRGGADLRALRKAFVTRARTIVIARGREFARRLNLPVRDGLASALLDLTSRGVTLRLVFTPEAPGQYMLQARASAIVAQLSASGALAVELVGDVDRNFTARWAQQRIRELIVALAGAAI